MMNHPLTVAWVKSIPKSFRVRELTDDAVQIIGENSAWVVRLSVKDGRLIRTPESRQDRKDYSFEK